MRATPWSASPPPRADRTPEADAEAPGLEALQDVAAEGEQLPGAGGGSDDPSGDGSHADALFGIQDERRHVARETQVVENRFRFRLPA